MALLKVGTQHLSFQLDRHSKGVLRVIEEEFFFVIFGYVRTRVVSFVRSYCLLQEELA